MSETQAVKKYLKTKSSERLGVKLFAVSFFAGFAFCKVYNISDNKPRNELNGYFSVNDLFYLNGQPYINPKTKKPQ